MLVAARGLAEILANRRTLQVADRDFITFMNLDILGVDMLIWIFAIVAALGWVLLNRTTFGRRTVRSEEHTSELQSLMRISYAVFCLKKTKKQSTVHVHT